MRVEQSMFRKAKDNIYFITHSVFPVIILLTSGNSFIAFFFCVCVYGKEKNWKMHSAHNVIEVFSFFQSVKIRMKLPSAI